MNLLNIVQMARNPQALINQLQNTPQMQNPMVQNALKMYQNGDSKGLENLARNLCKEKGFKVEDVKQQIMSQINMR